MPSEDNDDVVNVDDGDDGVDGTQLTRVSDSDDQCPNTLTRYYKVNMRPRSSNRHHHQLFEGKINTCKFLQIKYFPPDKLPRWISASYSTSLRQPSRSGLANG